MPAGAKIIVQIYEVQTPAEAESMLALGVDHIGSVIVSADSWKIAALRATVQTIQAGGGQSSLIPLFSDQNTVSRVLDYYRPNIVHFCEDLIHGRANTPGLAALLDLQANIRHRFPEIRIMRSIPIAPPGNASGAPTLALARRFEPLSDYFLTDTLLPKGDEPDQNEQPVKGFVGITGRICDWAIAAELVKASRIPVILAGGLAPDNVYDGILQVRPAGVDSCTRTNAVDQAGRVIRFQKDTLKVQTLVAETRRAEQALAQISARKICR